MIVTHLATRRIAISLTLLAVLGACAAQQAGEFPSLAIRPQENAAPRSDNVAAAPVQADAALLKVLSDLKNQIAIGEAAFRNTLPRAQAAITAANGAAPASEPWVLAAMQLAALEFDRAPAQEALADFDTLLVDKSTQNDTKGAAELQAGWTAANAVVTEQTRLIEGLKSQLSPA
jgi:hypothetical protein